MKYEFVIPGEPMGKERPRFSHVGKYVHTYTPPKTVRYEKKVRESLFKECESVTVLKGAIRAEIHAVFPIPTSTKKKLRAEMEQGNVPYTKKYDIDNVIKIVLDALNEVVYEDDKQVTEVYATKVYGKEPCVKVIIEELTDEVV